jgi:hypothetical protein
MNTDRATPDAPEVSRNAFKSQKHKISFLLEPVIPQPANISTGDTETQSPMPTESITKIPELTESPKDDSKPRFSEILEVESSYQYKDSMNVEFGLVHTVAAGPLPGNSKQPAQKCAVFIL